MRRRSIFRGAPLRDEHDAAEAVLYDVQVSGLTALGMTLLLLADGGYMPALAALTRPCPAMPWAQSIEAATRRLADLQGRDEDLVDHELFMARARAWRDRGVILGFKAACDALGIGAAFADAALGREWPIEEAEAAE